MCKMGIMMQEAQKGKENVADPQVPVENGTPGK